MILVESARPRSSSALRNCARLLSAFLIPASDVGPLMPGVMVLRLSPVLCWLPSGSRDQNTSTNGLLGGLNIRSQAVAATSGLEGCSARIPLVGAGVWSAAGQRRAVRDGEGWKQRMRVLEIDALVAHLGHCGGGLRRHDAPAQAVRHEQNQVTRRGVLRGGRTSSEREQAGR